MRLDSLLVRQQVALHQGQGCKNLNHTMAAPLPIPPASGPPMPWRQAGAAEDSRRLRHTFDTASALRRCGLIPPQVRRGWGFDRRNHSGAGCDWVSQRRARTHFGQTFRWLSQIAWSSSHGVHLKRAAASVRMLIAWTVVTVRCSTVCNHRRTMRSGLMRLSSPKSIHR